MSKNENVFFDIKYVSGLVTKYKKSNKFLKNIIIGISTILLCLVIFCFFNVSKTKNYQRYLDKEINLYVNNVVKQTLKTKFLVDECIENTISNKDFVELILSLNITIENYRNINDILLVALDTISPEKVKTFTRNLFFYIKSIYLKNYNQENIILNNDEIEILKKYNNILNKIIFIQSELIMNDVESQENNLYLYNLDFTDVDSIDRTFEEKYNNKLMFNTNNVQWIDALVKTEALITQNKE